MVAGRFSILPNHEPSSGCASNDDLGYRRHVSALEMFRSNLATLALGSGLVALMACAPTAKQRSWPKTFPYNNTSELEWRGQVSRGEFDEARSLAMQGGVEQKDLVAVFAYGTTMMAFLWEVDPLLEQREREAADPNSRYREPSVIAGIDRGEIVAEFEARLDEIEAHRGQLFGARLAVWVAGKDCEALVADIVQRESCYPSGSMRQQIKDDLELTEATCGEVEPYCRALRDTHVDPLYQYEGMRACAVHIGGDEREALATFASAEEIELYKAVEGRVGEIASGQVSSASFSNSAADQDQYQRDLAEYESKQSDIEAISQIDGPGAPDRPNRVTVRHVDYEGLPITEPATALVRNDCPEAVTVTVKGGADEATTVEPGETARLAIHRCESLLLRLGGVAEQLDDYHSESGFVFEVDCRSSRQMSRAELEAALAE